MLVGILSIFIANRQINYFESHRQAIIFGPSVVVKVSPDSKSNSLFVIHEGLKVDVLSTNNDWIRIRLANGNEGWITYTDAKEI